MNDVFRFDPGRPLEPSRFEREADLPTQTRRREARDGRLARPRAAPTSQRLGASERLFLALRRKTPTTVARLIAVEGSIGIDALMDALRALEERHPLLRTRVVDDGDPRFVHDAASAIPLVLVRRRDDAHAAERLEQLLRAPISGSSGAGFELHALIDDVRKRTDLILVGDHILCDGVSMNQLAGELVALVAGDRPGGARPTLPVLDAMLPSAGPLVRIRSITGSVASFARIAALRAAFESRRTATESSYATFELDADETRALVTRARAERTTVTGFLMAAIAKATRERSHVAPRIALSVPIDLRPRIPGFRLRADDLGNYTNATYLETSGAASVGVLARGLRAELDAALDPEPLLASLPLVFRFGEAFVDPRRRPLAHAMVSNSGVVPMRAEYGSFRVTSFRSATSLPMISADAAFFCNTFDGRLRVNVVHAESILSREEAAILLDRTRTHLLGERR